MAGQADNRSADKTGSPVRRSASRSRLGHKPAQLAAVPMGPETAPSVPIANPAAEEAMPDTAVTTQVPLAPDILPRLIATQASYRYLVSSGLTGAEAAGVIGYVTGISSATGRWSLSQINRFLFLRNMYSETAWGNEERRPA